MIETDYRDIIHSDTSIFSNEVIKNLLVSENPEVLNEVLERFQVPRGFSEVLRSTFSG